jgi:hypothetical protein
VLALAAAAALARPALVDAQEKPDERFGLNGILPDGFDQFEIPPHNWMQLAKVAGARSNRYELRWDRIQREPGPGDWAAADWIVNENVKAGLSLTVVITGTPPWARTIEGSAVSPPINLDQPALVADRAVNPDNPWANFLFFLARRYAGKVAAWEIWNEPNLSTFWRGSAYQYYQLLKSGYLALKAGDPKATVVMSGLSGAGLDFLKQIIELITTDPEAPAHGGFFDIFSWHGYTRPTRIFEYTNSYRTLLGASGLRKIVWIGETGVPAWDDPKVARGAPVPFGEGATQEEQAHFVVQAYAYGLAAGAARIGLYRASDVGEIGFPGTPSQAIPGWGVTRLDGSARPAYHAYQTIVTLLKGATLRQMQRAEGFDRISFQGHNRDVHILFATGEGGHRGTAPAFRGERAVQLDIYGRAVPIVAVNRQFGADLWGSANQLGSQPGDPIVSGPPVIIVEGAVPGIPPGGGIAQLKPY